MRTYLVMYAIIATSLIGTVFSASANITKLLLSSPTFNESMVETLLMRDDLNYLLYDDLLGLLDQLEIEFPSLITVESIGYTYENRPINMITLTDTETAIESLLITGAHHARELSSIQLPVFAVLKILHGYLHNDQHIRGLLNQHKVYAVPVINVDGFSYISQEYESTEQLVYKRKNQNPSYNGYYDCPEVDQGIDLNRNYDWEFGGSGSSWYPCAEDFRGPSAFSEPETQAIKNLIESKKDELSIVYNFHVYGNLFLHPFSSDIAQNNRLFQLFPTQAQIYKELWNEIGLPKGNMKGNGVGTVGYDSDGEASDWILATHGIVAASIELGTSDLRSFDFFITDRDVVIDILQQNVDPIIFTLKKLNSQLGFQHSDTGYKMHSFNDHLNLTFEIINKGFTATNQTYFEFEISSGVFIIESIENIQVLSNITADGLQYYICAINQSLDSRETKSFNLVGTLNERIWRYDQYELFMNITYREFELGAESKTIGLTFRDVDYSNEDLKLFIIGEKQKEDKERLMIAMSTCFIVIVAALLVFFFLLKHLDQKKSNTEDKLYASRQSLLVKTQNE